MYLNGNRANLYNIGVSHERDKPIVAYKMAQQNYVGQLIDKFCKNYPAFGPLESYKIL